METPTAVQLTDLMNPLNCYAKLNGKADYLFTYRNWIIKYENCWTDHFGFKAAELNCNAVLKKEPLLEHVNMYAPIARMGLLLVKASTFYNWHVDEHRLSCINLLLSTENHSHTLFGIPYDDLNRKILELKYEPKQYYLFNNQVQHCVCNLDKDRYLFSIYFQKEMPFKDIRETLKKANLLAESVPTLF